MECERCGKTVERTDGPHRLNPCGLVAHICVACANQWNELCYSNKTLEESFIEETIVREKFTPKQCRAHGKLLFSLRRKTFVIAKEFMSAMKVVTKPPSREPCPRCGAQNTKISVLSEPGRVFEYCEIPLCKQVAELWRTCYRIETRMGTVEK